MINQDEKPHRIVAPSQPALKLADSLRIHKLLPVLDGATLKMHFLFESVRRSRRVRYWYQSDSEVAVTTGLRFEQVARARKKLSGLSLIDFRLKLSGAMYRWPDRVFNKKSASDRGSQT